MPSPLNFRKNVSRFFGWSRRTLDDLCGRPDHLQRLSIIGSGISIYPLLLGTIAILVWMGTAAPDSGHLGAVIPIIGIFGYGFIALFALAQVALLGIIKGLRVSGPGGMSVSIQTTADDPDVDPSTSRNNSFDMAEDEGARAPRHDRRGGRPMPQINVTQVVGEGSDGSMEVSD